MNELVIILAAILPGLVLGIYIWKRDPKPEPTYLLLKAIIYGALICVPVVIVESVLSTLFFGVDDSPTSLIGTIVESFGVEAIPEEVFKLLALWLILKNNSDYDEHFDGIVYAVCIGLGFATVENVLYLFDNIDNWQGVACVRALLAVPAHYIFAILMGYYYSIFHFVNRSKENFVLIIFVPVLAHGIYDTLALSGRVEPALGSTFTAVLIYFCFKMHKLAQEKVMKQIEKDLN